MSYEQRLKTLNAESLELRRLKSDLILVFKISRGCTAVDNKIIIIIIIKALLDS